MKYSEEQINEIVEKIVELLKEKEEMRTGKIAKVLIHQGLVQTSHEVEKTLKYKKDLFISPKIGVWRLIDAQ
ncbi:hypothetical protein [Romboutsia sp.]|uniref:hypothetical protein n=1 Tax=Romboutsia sp. TaxID=1965302 RepID=UPI003F300C31